MNNIIVDMENAHNIDHREEVRKLQNLVRELEVQNMQLRHKQLASDVMLGKRTAETLENVSQGKHAGNKSNAQGEDCNSECLDDVELIDVGHINLSAEDSWLYEPPDDLVREEQKHLSPYKWMRSDVDDPKQLELQAVKRSLVRQIENLSTEPVISKPGPDFFERDDCCIPKNAFSTKLYDKLHKELGILPDRHRGFDSRTFTRPKKTANSELPVVDVETMGHSPKLSTITSPSSDVIDIQTIARLQEECLRQSSSPSTPRRNSAGTGTASRTSSNSTSPSMSPFGSQNLDEPFTGKLKPISKKPNGLVTPQALTSLNQHKQSNQTGCDVNICDKASGRIPRYSLSPSSKGGSNSRSGSPAASRLSAPTSYRNSPPLEEVQHESRLNLSSRIPKPRTGRTVLLDEKRIGRN